MDESIRLSLAEKQKIVCDIFRVPNEHFSAIADIAGQPEAPKVTLTISFQMESNFIDFNSIFVLYLIQEPSDILLAAFAQVQSLTEALNEYTKIPRIQPSEMLVKSVSLCDDCFRNAEKHYHEQQEYDRNNKSLQVTASSTTTTQSSNTSISNSQSPTTVINNKLSDSTTDTIIPDDDGYCNIDEIRLPAIPIKSPNHSTPDARRISLAAPLPQNESKEIDETMSKSISESISETSSITAPTQITNSEMKQESPSTDQSLSVSSNLPSNASATKPGDEHIEVNYAYDSLSRPLSELNLNNDAKITATDSSLGGKTKATCDNNAMHHSVPAIPCHLISAYIAALNLHVSQLLVRNFLTIFLNLNKKKQDYHDFYFIVFPLI